MNKIIFIWCWDLVIDFEARPYSLKWAHSCVKKGLKYGSNVQKPKWTYGVTKKRLNCSLNSPKMDLCLFWWGKTSPKLDSLFHSSKIWNYFFIYFFCQHNLMVNMYTREIFGRLNIIKCLFKNYNFTKNKTKNDMLFFSLFHFIIYNAMPYILSI